MSFEPLVKMFVGRSLLDDFELPDYGIWIGKRQGYPPDEHALLR